MNKINNIDDTVSCTITAAFEHKQRLMKAGDVLCESIDSLQSMIKRLKDQEIYGPFVPALQRMEESIFWLSKCQKETDAYTFGISNKE